MAVVSYNKEQLTNIIEQYHSDARKIEEIRSGIEEQITQIREVWTGSGEELSGREKDFANIIENLEKIKMNVN